MEVDIQSKEDLIKKYRLAGKIRFISFCLLLLFLLIMKFVGGYSYLNTAFIALIFVEAILNQPYNFIVRRVDISRLQYYQMTIDIIAISWILYYMGGIEAPLVSIGYYVVILWAGVVSSTHAVLFATIVSAVLFASVVVLGHIEVLPLITYFSNKIPLPQMISRLCGNVSFLFAFGYFCVHSSGLIKLLERKRREEALRYSHKLVATGNLVGNTAHDLLNYLASIKGFAELLLHEIKDNEQQAQMLKSIQRSEQKVTDILTKLGRFSQKPKQEFEPYDIHNVIEDALGLTWPLIRYSDMTVEKIFGKDIPLIMIDKDQMQEVFVALIFNTLDAVSKNGKLSIETSYLDKINMVEIKFSDTGKGIKQEDLGNIAKPFFSTKSPEKGAGMGLTIVYGVIALHKGSIGVKSRLGEGTTFTIKLPVTQSHKDHA
ncbi:MAG: ATP-binding protein [Candidatus Omnitrophota bacterium]